jgi:molecular chaperone HscA
VNLAYPGRDGRLMVMAVDTTGKRLWKEWRPTAATAEEWAGIVALPDGVALFADASADSTPRDMVVLDGSGEQRWVLTMRGDDAVYFTAKTAVWLDRTSNRLVGLRLHDRWQEWSRDNPRNKYGDARTAVLPVRSGEAVSGPAYLDGTPRAPWEGEAHRLVQIGADRSVRVIDMDSGTFRSRAAVADTDEPVVARDDRLYVVEDNEGLRLLSYDLDSLGEPATLYTSGDEGSRARSLVTCGEHRACLLEVPDAGPEGTKVVVATEGKKARSWAAPNAETLVPLGEHLLARQDSPKSTVTLFDPDGTAKLRDREGVAARLDAGNLLLFGNAPSSSEGDRSLAGMAVGEAEPVPMGDLKDVRSGSCSWNTQVIACGAEKDFVLYRFAG